MKKRSSLRLILAFGSSLALPLLCPGPAPAQMNISLAVGAPPPPLPVYVQPPIPAYGYLWVPGYWAWNGDDYFWVPGAWVLPPEPGLLWTPGYWGWNGGAYVFNPGYWGPTVGFYGGVNCGYGYFGDGFAGGYWRNGGFFYNSAVTNIGNANITNVYVNNVTVNRNLANVSYNGGQGGLTAQPTAAERAAASQPHFAPTALQTQHFAAARADRALTASANHGVPPIAATPTAGRLNGPGVARAAAYGGALGGGAHALSPSIAVPHGVSSAHALPAPGTIPHAAASNPAMQAFPHARPNFDHALPTSAYHGAVRNTAIAAPPRPLSPPFAPFGAFGAPGGPRVGAPPPPPFARAMPRGPQATGALQGPRPVFGRAPPPQHPAAAPRDPHHPG
jgi:hypothetical protein